jgi:pentatricopeptide repeat protein
LSQTAITKAELRSIVEVYDGEAQLWSGSSGDLNVDHPDVSIMDDDEVSQDRVEMSRSLIPTSGKHKDTILQIEALLKQEDSSHDDIFRLYQTLPYPRVACMKNRTVRNLLHYLAVVEHKDEASMLRYLSVIDDMKVANIPIGITEWTSAIAFAGQCSTKITTAEVQSALFIWKEMERKADIQGNYVTFNVLFDIAMKAGKFALAEALMKEMNTRKIPFSRYFKTSYIYFCGLRKDGSGIRAAYRDLVESDHVVDTVVINTVIKALMLADEPVAAEHVFYRMKALHAEKVTPRLYAKTWRDWHQLGRYMSDAHFNKDAHPEVLQRLHELSPVAPNLYTYCILLGYHTKRSGNIDRVIELLEEMQDTGLEINRTVFRHLFQGFSIFGGVPYSMWTYPRLERIWKSLNDALESGTNGIGFDKQLAYFCVLAFARCASHDRSLTIWSEIKTRWKPSLEDEIWVNQRLDGASSGAHV